MNARVSVQCFGVIAFKQPYGSTAVSGSEPLGGG